jgi:hypothetical protein
MNDPHEDLPGRQAAQHIRTQRPLTNQFHEVAHHRQGHIGFDQRAPYVANGIQDVFVGQSPTAANLIEYSAQAITQRIEHDSDFGMEADYRICAIVSWYAATVPGCAVSIRPPARATSA